MVEQNGVAQGRSDLAAYSAGTSIFDPVLVELIVRWFSPDNAVVLDPFAGGSVRGIVTSKLGRRYVGVDLSERQIEENRKQASTICAHDRQPDWRVGDSTGIAELCGDVEADLVFSCPPYGSLESYSDDPRDLSTMSYTQFLNMYRLVIKGSLERLKPDRFACFVVGDFRDKDGFLCNFPGYTIQFFEEFGARLYNYGVLLTAVGSLPIRVGRGFEANRKLGNTHQEVLFFVKGSWEKAAAEWQREAVIANESVDINLYGEGLLGGSVGTKRQGNLSEKFLIPPFNVFNARDGYWQNRKRSWLSLGIKSEIGRGGDLMFNQERINAAMARLSPGGSPRPAMHAGSGGLLYKSHQVNAQKLNYYREKEKTKAAVVPATTPDAPAAVTLAPAALTRPTPPPAAVMLAPRAYAAPAQPTVQLAPRMPITDWVLPELPTVRGMGCKIIGFDTEGTGLRPFHGDRAGGFSVKFGADGPGIYVPFGHKRGVNFDRDTVARWWKSEMETYTGDVVFTFALFDLIFASREGFEFKSARAFHDTCVRETLLDEHVGDNSLNGQALRYLGRGKDEAQLNEIAAYYGIKDVKKHMMDIPPEYMGRYATTDPTLSLGVYHAQETALANQELLPIYEIERKQIPILFGMLKRGVRIDVPRAEALLGKLNTELSSWEERFHRMAGNGAEFRSPATLAPVLRDRGLDVPKTKPSKAHPDGQDSITEDWLLDHKGTDGIIDATLACRRVATIATYVEKSVLGQAVDGRVHPWFNQLMRDRDDGGKRGAATGRYSCTDPNAQQVAKREKLIDADLEMDEEISKSVRRLFPPEEGEDWQRDDYSQEEFRINVHAAVGGGADDARARYNNEPKLSFHKMAGEMAGLDITDKKLYDRIKALNLAKSYGAQPKKLSKVLKCSVEDAKAFVEVYERQLPFTVATFKEAQRVAAGRGYVRTLLGRRLRFPFWEPPNNHGERYRRPLPHAQAVEAYGPNVVRAGVYRALNWYCQGSAADILKKALVDAHEAGVFDAIGFPLLIVHDEIDTSIPRTREGDEAGRELTRIMESTVKLKVPLLVESGRGVTWGDCA